MDLLGLGKVTDNGLKIMKMVYPDLAQPGVQKVGQALGTVLDLGNTILLPLKLANANANVFFQHHMDNYRKKMEAIPEENVGVVQPTIGLKILDELFTVTNEDIAELFLNLLVNASTVERAKYAHPGFIDVIKNLSSDEAKIFNEFYMNNQYVLFTELVVINFGSSIYYDVISSNIVDHVELDFPENSNFYLNNLSRCGLIAKFFKFFKEEIGEFESLDERLLSEVKRAEEQLAASNMETARVELHKGKYEITPFGEIFKESITLTEKLELSI
ncbi:DUF4393 domain-containing protein [Paenibacillus sp. NPDC058177]|uniref:DUF4393 domain-containing protein n=1 Tax=Paenibacillus sp. NPDC058177 TaxID=3346369 RepID=UPI0036D83C77